MCFGRRRRKEEGGKKEGKKKKEERNPITPTRAKRIPISAMMRIVRAQRNE